MYWTAHDPSLWKHEGAVAEYREDDVDLFQYLPEEQAPLIWLGHVLDELVEADQIVISDTRLLQNNIRQTSTDPL